jgi:hypothetical protein
MISERAIRTRPMTSTNSLVSLSFENNLSGESDFNFTAQLLLKE